MKALISALALAATGLGIAGCSKQQEAPEGGAKDAPVQGQEAMSVENARLVLPAVAGNPAGVFFELSNDGDAAATLQSVSVTHSGMAMMHDVVEEDGAKKMVPLDPVTLDAGTRVSFAPGGKHVMAMQLDDTVMAGGSVDVSLRFADGETFTFPARVVAAGQAE